MGGAWGRGYVTCGPKNVILCGLDTMAFLTRLIRGRVVQPCSVPLRCLSDGHQRGDSTSGDRFVKDQVQYSLEDVGLVGPKQAFGVKSNWELFRGWMVFKMFTYDSLVDNSFKVLLNRVGSTSMIAWPVGEGAV